MIKKLIQFLGSMHLTLISLTGLFVVVLVSTLAQVDLGIYLAMKTYFEGLFIYWSPTPSLHIPVFPTGYVWGVIILINLIVAHFKRFQWKLQKLGIWLIHLGLIVLIIGSGIVASKSVETQLAIEEGQTKFYTQSPRLVELAILSDKTPSRDNVISVPASLLAKQKTISDAVLPFDIHVLAYFKNSNLMVSTKNTSIVNRGIGTRIQLMPLPPRYDQNYRNMVSVIAELKDGETSLGIWLLSTGLGKAQQVQVNDKTYRLQLRPTRTYPGFSIKLVDFTHDVYAGTDIPKNFASKVLVQDEGADVTEEALIYMNHPLRHRGYTFYQASFGKEDTLSVLQVVQNPGWLLPYISTLLMSIGMLIHFGFHLAKFIRRRKKEPAS